MSMEAIISYAGDIRLGHVSHYTGSLGTYSKRTQQVGQK